MIYGNTNANSQSQHLGSHSVSYQQQSTMIEKHRSGTLTNDPMDPIEGVYGG